MRNLRLVLVAIAACVVAGCASPSGHQASAPTTKVERVPPTSRQPSSTADSVAPGPACAGGTVTVTAEPGGQPTPVCATVGSLIVLRGGNEASGGTWPGPAEVSDTSVVTIVSSHPDGAGFTAQLRAVGAGNATVTMPFEAKSEVCDPTPCTPIPGAPLHFAVRVIS